MALVTKNFSDIITFTRASTATYFDSTGTLQSAAIDAPRFDYNPSTLAAQGLLIEEARTNLVLQSEDFATTWSTTTTIVTADATTAPDGGVNADKIAADTSTGLHLIQQSSSYTSGVAYTFSVFVKAAEYDTVRFQLSSAAFGVTVVWQFNTATQTVTPVTGTSGTTFSWSSVNNGWYRLVLTAQATATASASFSLLVISPSGSSYTGDGTSGLYLWGAQIEAGAFPTSYIPTTTTALTRAADVASVNTLSPWYNATEGTLFAEFSVYTSIGSKAIAGITDGTTNNRIQFFASAADPYNVSPRLVSGGVATNPSPAGSVTVGSTGKAALAYAIGTNQGGISVNGSAVNQSSPASAFGSVTQLELGKGSGLTQTNGYLRRVVFYPRRLSNAELQSLTV